ncbi:hypothetical protein RchiOBHm_Chr2g0127391 [Rosa chinensis]|uniref:Uncharacterized protein n=1 Tax=Rosa chinensis TaxID=74649 RepID=A0A2P6RU12_ROSCH|nr:hypothetical protein RchiOBHm_Chr2g0127391 [Rosa chinensis]
MCKIDLLVHFTFIYSNVPSSLLLFPFMSSFPLFSSEVLKIETNKKNRNFPKLKMETY